jgi:hypothetical protein
VSVLFSAAGGGGVPLPPLRWATGLVLQMEGAGVDVWLAATGVFLPMTGTEQWCWCWCWVGTGKK